MSSSALADTMGHGFLHKKQGSGSSLSSLLSSGKEKESVNVSPAMLHRSTSTTSSSSIPFVRGEVELVTEEGVRHADGTLDAR